MNEFPQIKYLVFDLDDTLLNKKKEITPFTKKVLLKAKLEGFKIVINTARSVQNSQSVIDVIHPDYGIYSGGCHIIGENGETLYSKTIDKETVKQASRELNKKCEKISVQTKENFYASDEEYKGQNAIHYDFTNGLEEEAYKILCFSYDLDMVKDVASKYNLELQNYLNGGWNRLSVKGATKFHGVELLSQILKVDLSTFACFGDDIGDIEMIQKAGLGVAMSNSKKELLDVAKHITLSNEEDGCALFVQRYLL
ncbi:MAG: HAD family hydrolase [Bacilli bacterium]|nr:HAD family hydrolase [Bacilli bacterium]